MNVTPFDNKVLSLPAERFPDAERRRVVAEKIVAVQIANTTPGLTARRDTRYTFAHAMAWLFGGLAAVCLLILVFAGAAQHVVDLVNTFKL